MQIEAPIIAKINYKSMDIVNNERFKIIKIENNNITIQNKNKILHLM